MYKPLMKCGHTANAQTLSGEPCCAICNCYEIKNKESLDGRKAKCSSCGKIVDSEYDLPFFRFEPDKEYDSFYCGCWGWD